MKLAATSLIIAVLAIATSHGTGNAVIASMELDGAGQQTPDIGYVSVEFARDRINLPLQTNVSWTNFTIEEFKETLGCNEVFSKPRPIHDESTWSLLREISEDILGAQQTPTDYVASLNSSSDGFAVPYYVDYSPGKGRGIFAAENIKANALIWSNAYTAKFEAAAFRQYLQSLSPSLACEVIEWAYVDEHADNKELSIMVDLDPMSFCNDGGMIARNIEWMDYDTGTFDSDFAIRDIKAGEEILCDYASFDETTEQNQNSWNQFGLWAPRHAAVNSRS